MHSSSSPPCPQPAAKNPTGRKTQIQTHTDTTTVNFNFISCLQFTNAREVVGQWSTFNNHFTHKLTNEKLQKHKYLKGEPHKYTCSQFAKGRGPVGERLVAAIGNQFIVRSSSGLSPTQLCCCQVYKTGFKSVASLSLSADPLLFSTLLYCCFSPRVVW